MRPADYKTVPDERQIGRRGFLRWSAVGLLSTVIPNQAFAAVRDSLTPKKFLAFHNTHTREDLSVVYWTRGSYVGRALTEVNHILRDYRTGEIKAIDPQLLDVLYTLREKLGSRRPFHVISGYRSAKTNALLRAQGHGVARHSLHMEGKAIDIRLPGCKLAVLRRAAVDLKAGGVGYYPRSDFVHVDVGRVRYW